MFHSRKLNNNINKLPESALRITYRDHNSSFESLLEKDASTTIHTKSLKVKLTEMFKTKNGHNPEFMLQVYPLRKNHYSLRYNNKFLQPKVKRFHVEWSLYVSEGRNYGRHSLLI